jgi:hypothetical protein
MVGDVAEKNAWGKAQGRREDTLMSDATNLIHVQNSKPDAWRGVGWRKVIGEAMARKRA